MLEKRVASKCADKSQVFKRDASIRATVVGRGDEVAESGDLGFSDVVAHERESAGEVGQGDRAGVCGRRPPLQEQPETVGRPQLRVQPLQRGHDRPQLAPRPGRLRPDDPLFLQAGGSLVRGGSVRAAGAVRPGQVCVFGQLVQVVGLLFRVQVDRQAGSVQERQGVVF